MNTQHLKSTILPIGQGIVVTMLGVWLPLILLALIPGLWGILTWIAFLIVFVLVASGKLGWKTSAPARAHRFRLGKANKHKLLLGFILALLFVVIGQSLLMVTFRLIPFPHDNFVAGLNLEGLSNFEFWLIIVLLATGAGVYEEIGFRGYMQVPLEEKHGFLRANLLVSFIFMIFHLNQPWAKALLFQLFVLSFLFGVIAYVSGSLLPGILGHTLIDIFNFGYWWTDFFGVYEHSTIFESSPDPHFWIWSFTLIVSTFLFVYISRFTLSLNDKKSKTSIETADPIITQLST